MKRKLLEIKNISKVFSDKIILKDISFDFYDGEVLGVLGLSGSGKTTLLNIICGLLKPDIGIVLYNISETLQLNYVGRKVKPLIGFSTQEPSFYPELSIWENLEFFGKSYEIEDYELYDSIKKTLLLLDLDDSKKTLAKNLSEGMQKRLNIGCSIVHRPKILILDEPTANLDFRLKEEFLNYVKKINKEGVSIFFISHHIDEIERVSLRVLMIHNKGIKIIKNTKKITPIFMKFIKNG